MKQLCLWTLLALYTLENLLLCTSSKGQSEAGEMWLHNLPHIVAVPCLLGQGLRQMFLLPRSGILLDYIHPATPSNCRPVALTSHVIKPLERLILNHLHMLVEPWLDPSSTCCIRHISTWMWQETPRESCFLTSPVDLKPLDHQYWVINLWSRT